MENVIGRFIRRRTEFASSRTLRLWAAFAIIYIGTVVGSFAIYYGSTQGWLSNELAWRVIEISGALSIVIFYAAGTSMMIDKYHQFSTFRKTFIGVFWIIFSCGSFYIISELLWGTL